jgi:hypothetical protein
MTNVTKITQITVLKNFRKRSGSGTFYDVVDASIYAIGRVPERSIEETEGPRKNSGVGSA